MNANTPIALVVTGSIAAIKTLPLIEELQAAGKDVTLILTRAPEEWNWVNLADAKAATGHEVLTDSSPLEAKQKALRSSQAILVLSSADFASQVAYESTDLGRAISEAHKNGTALAFAPAMNFKIWEHLAVRKNFEDLHARGAIILGPVKGPMACGDEGYGRMIDVTEMVEGLQAALKGTPSPALDYYTKAHDDTAPQEETAEEPLRPAGENDHVLVVLCGKVDLDELEEMASAFENSKTPVAYVLDPSLPNSNEILARLKNQEVITDHFQKTETNGKKDGMEHIRLPKDWVVYPFLDNKTAQLMAEGRGGKLTLDIALASKAPVLTTRACINSLKPDLAARLSEIRVGVIPSVARLVEPNNSTSKNHSTPR